MMLEQSLISPNFLGKESFRWFIAICTEYKQVDDLHGGGYKAKVRIIGHHPGASSVISDPELPWAHVLVPLNMGAGSGGTGSSFNSVGGEYVIGFFMDGDNGQQPVIIGALFTGENVDVNEFFQGTNEFKSFKPKKYPINKNNIYSDTGKTSKSGSGIPSSKGNLSRIAGVGSTTVKSVSTAAKKATDITDIVSIPQKCNNANSTFSKIITTLKKFLYTIQQIQGIINKTLGAISSIPELVNQVAQVLTDLFYAYIKKIRDAIIGKIYNILKDTIEKILPKDIKLFKQLITDKVVDVIKCAFYKIIKKLSEFLINFLLQIVDKAISIPLCAAEALVGSVLSTISSEITDAIGPALQEFSNAIGGAIGSVDKFVSQALFYADAAVNFFTCESLECTPVYDYSMNKGWVPPGFIENYERIINYPNVGVQAGIQAGKEAAEKWLAITGAGGSDLPPELSSSFGGCDITTLECGLPNITFFGGGGAGAAGLAVVDSLGQLIGVNLTNSGSGYSSPPYVSIDDPCGNGGGARARSKIGVGGTVVSVIIDDPGYGYGNLNGDEYLDDNGYLTPDGDPCTINPVDSSGSEVIGYLVDVNIIRTGVGYTAGDLIIDTACSSDIEIYPVVNSNGEILDVNIVNPGTSIRVFPQLEINSASGEGAVLQPILAFKPVESMSVETNKNKIQKVVLCAEDHGV